MPSLLFEQGSRAVPVDFRRLPQHRLWRRAGTWLRAPHRCRPAGLGLRPRRRLPGRGVQEAGSGGRRLLRPARRQSLHPVLDLLRGLRDLARRSRSLGEEGYHPDDWEGVQIRIGPDGTSTSAPPLTRATTSAQLSATGAPTPGPQPLRDAAEAVGAASRERLGAGDPSAARLRRQPRRRRHRHPPRRPLHPRPPRPPDPARADRRDQRRQVRDQPALAEESLARP